MKRLLMLSVILGISTIALAQEPFFTLENDQFPLAATTINSMDVESADVDNDGDLDLVVAGEFSRNLLLFNNGNGLFTEDQSRLFPDKNLNDNFSGEDSEDIVFADFDLNGTLDVLFVSEDTSFHELLVNDGTGLFTHIGFNFPSSAGNAVAVLDLNNDNYPDIIIGNNGQNSVFLNDQDLTFTEDASRWPVNSEGTQDFKLVDLNDDGNIDIIEGIDSGSNNILINSNGFFTEENNRLPDTGLTLETRKLSLGDINGDDAVDIFVSTVNFTGSANLQNRLYVNDGNGFFTDVTATQIPIYQQQTLDAVFLDYDMDGDLDLISTDFQNPSGNYHAFMNDGAGNFVESTSEVFEDFNYSNGIGLHAADVNDDGFDDLYFANFQETDDLLYFNELALSVISEENPNALKIIPNPVKDTLRIGNLKVENPSQVKLRISDIQGRVVLETLAKMQNNANMVTVDVKNLVPGSYTVSVFLENEYKFSTKFIKSK